MTIPGSLREGGWKDYAGRVSLHRSFGRPTNLAANERVWLVIEEVVGEAVVRLNEATLGAIAGHARIDVTSRLAIRNELVIEIDATADGCGIVGDVVLEIESRRLPTD